MISYGKVIGGAYLDSSVTTAKFGSDLVVQSGFKPRKLTAETVTSWAVIPVEANVSAMNAMGRAAAGVALPGRFGKAASAAVGAAFDSKKPVHHVRIDWADGKQSLLKLPDAMFTHFELMLASQCIASPEPAPVEVRPEVEEAQPTVTDRAFDLVSGIVKDRFPAKKQQEEQEAAAVESASSVKAPQADVADQLHKLASLRDAGILTEEEFSTKKAELLGRF